MRVTLPALIILLFITSCQEQNTKPSAAGRSGELLVVMPEALWRTDVADAIQSTFAKEQYGLPQAEPLFRVVSVNKENFSGLLKHHRNILMAEIAPGEPQMKYQKDTWARQQIVIKATAPDTVSLEVLLATQGKQLIEYFNNEERQRILAGYKKLREKTVESSIAKEFNMNLTIPEGYYIATHKDGFMWLRRENPDVSQGLMIYERPYIDTIDLNKNRILAVRDSISSLYIPGPEPNTYMITEMQYPPSHNPLEINNAYTIEMRGLWRTEGYFMGGPFINYSIVDSKNKRIITVDGFVYAPRFDKREYLRQLEAIIYSLELQ